MAKLSVNSNIEDTVKQLRGDARKQVPFAVSLAVNRTAQHVKAAQRDEMQRVFDKPVKFTLNSVYIDPADKRDDDPKATIWLKDYAPKGVAAAQYLRAEIFGGERNAKGTERLLQRRNLLPRGWYAMPGDAMRMTTAGNVNAGYLQKILSNLRAQFDTHQNTLDSQGLRAGASPSGGEFFVGRPGGGRQSDGPLGIWRRDGDKLKPMFIFTPDDPGYRARYDFNGVAQRVSDAELTNEFMKALDQALATAK